MTPRAGLRPAVIEKARDPRGALLRLAPLPEPVQAGAGRSSWLLVLIYTLLGLVGPYLMGVAIDRFISTRQAAGLAGIAAGDAGSSTCSTTCSRRWPAGSWPASRSGRSSSCARDLFGHLQTLPLRFFDRNPAGELMSRLTNDIDAINQAVSQNVTSLVASVLSLVGIVVAMFVLDRWLALASVLVVPIMFWFAEFVARYTRKGFRDCRRTWASSTA